MAAAQPYRNKMFKLAVLVFGAVILAGVISGRILRLGTPGGNFWLVFPALLLVFALAMVVVQRFWNKLDDLQKYGHLVSWYWGASAGGFVVLMALAAATGMRSPYLLGGAAVYLGQTVASLIVWVIWQLRLRGPAE